MEIIGDGFQRFLSTLALSAFTPKFFWRGGDLQTLRNSFMRSPPPLAPDRRLLAPLSASPDAGAISMAVNEASSECLKLGNIILVHGLGGSEDSSYMINTARFFQRAGYTVFRMNYRGVGPSAQHSAPPYSAGLTDDVRAVINAVAIDTGQEPIVLIGFSLGGQLTLRMLGEGRVDACIRAAVTVSAPLDLGSAQKALARPRNALYARYVVNNMKADLKDLCHPAVGVDITALSSVRAFDEHVIAPVMGYEGADDYYEKVSCFSVLNNISVPTMAIHAVDDPWIPVEAYRAAKWPHTAPAGCILTPSGGHVGFHASGLKMPWYQVAAHAFFQHCQNTEAA